MRFAPGLFALVFVFTMAFATGKEKKQPPPWNLWIEKDFPFFSCVVDARSEGIKDNLTPRAVVLPLENGHYLAYDLDLLRVAAVWKAQDLPFENASMSVNSYPYELRKVGSGQKTLPKPKGKILFQNGLYPGVGSGVQGSPSGAPIEGRRGARRTGSEGGAFHGDQTPLAHRV